MGMGFKHGLMDLNMRANEAKISPVDKESCCMPRATCTRDSGKMGRLMDRALICMDRSTLETERKIVKMGWGLSIGLMARTIRASIQMERDRD